MRGYTKRSESYRMLGQNQEAKLDAEQAIKLSPQFWKAHRELAIVNVNLGELEKGIAAFGQAIQLKPGSSTHLGYAYVSRGDAYRRLGQAQKAIEDLEAAIALKELGEAYASRAMAYALQGRTAEGWLLLKWTVRAQQDIAKVEELGVKEYPAATDLTVLKSDFDKLKGN